MWEVYIAECSDGSLYTGCTTDTKRRIKEHNDGSGAKYTRSRMPVKLLWTTMAATRSEAQRKEARIKKFSRIEKLEMIQCSIKCPSRCPHGDKYYAGSF